MKKKSVIYLFGEIFSKILPFLLLPYFTRMLGNEGYGELSLFQVYQNLVIIIITLGGDTLLSRSKFRYNSKVFEEIAIVVLFFYTIMFLLYLSLAICFNYVLPVYAIVSGYTYTLLNVILIKNQVDEQASSFLVVQVTSNLVVTIATVFLFENYSANYQYRAIAIIIGITSVFCFFLWKSKLRLRRRLFGTRLKLYLSLLASTSGAMFFHKISFFVRGQLDRVVVESKYGVAELATFALANQLATSIQILITAINMALVPVLYKQLKSNRNETLKKINSTIPYLFLVSIVLSILSYIIPSNIYNILFGPGFSDVGYFLPLFVFGFSIQSVYLIMSSVIIYEGTINRLAFATTCSSIAHVVFLMVLSNFEIRYVPFALVFSNLISICLVFKLSYKRLVKVEPK
ncbi:oligosaccharide flippase family protein [Vibrio harveyi]|uniref:oligosaccharide flippase family protein n=2 Tax=Vibrio harveyi TaxID=669 RepID=UPI00034B940B|nr:oligosaccharide flippase family protein [Vibrio harveyi]GEA22408.1 LPS biosynthesis protein [Vibrio harveyi]